ncbi:cupredoxin domain-containing protein [Dictyobacter formicarum]|uniref:Blue (type 1) copper domain-containing protein n=1 Tax=Dictyobacter formicarum TaxID=2778368 RepID=A0ABQ3VMD1_9CHLR|nr:plastocyanin/azurin family copper-binding protein [Dictyobacter formicarum]GHO87372.1 hypothetical protein KSZ_53780 [Dictyobacter formicarum]
MDTMVHQTAIWKRLFLRQPLSPLGKTAVTTLLILTVVCGLMSLLSISLLFIAALLLLIAAFLTTGIRWAPALSALISGVFLYVLLINVPFPVFHLMHPKDAEGTTQPWISYILFVVIVLMVGNTLLACAASSAALVQNYVQRPRRSLPWFPATLTGALGILAGMLLCGALVQPPAAASSSTTTNGEATAHMGISNFSPATITVSKGSKLKLVDDGSFHHTLSNGSWVNGQPQSEKVAGAPTVNNLDITGNSVEIGPFNTAGTYHIYCSLHSGMVLTITVK